MTGYQTATKDIDLGFLEFALHEQQPCRGQCCIYDSQCVRHSMMRRNIGSRTCDPVHFSAVVDDAQSLFYNLIRGETGSNSIAFFL